MPDFDERPIERAPLDEQPIEREPLIGAPPPEHRRASLTPVVIIAAAGLVLGALAAWWWTSGNRAPATATAPAAPTEEAVPPAEEAPPLPPLADMDPFLRTLLGALSSNPDFIRWLATPDLIRQMARGIDRVSRGQVPTADAAILQPSAEFTVAGRGSTRTIDPASYRRYDRVAALVSSLDAQGVAESYRTIYPRLDEAYRAMGRADSGVGQAVDEALRLLIETPIPDGPVRVVPGRGATYAYADPKLEQLAPVQKQLLRLGPDNARRVQEKLREIQSAIQAKPPSA